MSSVDDSSGSAASTDGPAADEVYCTSCGSVIKEEAELCPECGVRQRGNQPTQTTQKDPGIAAAASFLFTGLGQVYNGQIAKGLALIFLQFVNFLLMFVVIGFITFFITWIYGMYDAYKTAEKINRNEVQP